MTAGATRKGCEKTSRRVGLLTEIALLPVPASPRPDDLAGQPGLPPDRDRHSHLRKPDLRATELVNADVQFLFQERHLALKIIACGAPLGHVSRPIRGLARRDLTIDALNTISQGRTCLHLRGQALLEPPPRSIEPRILGLACAELLIDLGLFRLQLPQTALKALFRRCSSPSVVCMARCRSP